MPKEATTLPGASALDALLNLQALLAEQFASISTMQAAMTAQEAQVAKATPQLQLLPELQRQREDILSAIALGQVGNDQLQKIDEQIKKATLKHEDCLATLNVAKATISGLTRRLEVAQPTLAALKAQLRAARVEFLRAEAETEGAAYLLAATAARDSYIRLLSLSQLLAAEGAAAVLPHGGEICLPSFALDSVAPHAQLTPPYALFDPRLQRGLGRSWLARELERLRALGVEFDAGEATD